MIVGFTPFDAVNHAFATLATGGFSTRDGSVGAFENPAAEWIITFFMAAAALPFMRYVAVLNGRPGLLLRDSQVRTFIGILGVSILGLAAWLTLGLGRPWLDSLRAAAFNATSVITTAGFASEDYTLWGAGAIAFFLALSIVGGCTGSTTGGIKIFRFEILWISARLYVMSLFLPSRVSRPRYAGRVVDTEIILAVLSFAFFFMGAWGLTTVLLGALGADLVTAISASAAALANVGPGLGQLIGPAGNFQPLTDPMKWVLSTAMLLGRLEFFTVLVLLHPDFWRR
jgi:trk system potassium uptake protein TrkH